MKWSDVLGFVCGLSLAWWTLRALDGARRVRGARRELEAYARAHPYVGLDDEQLRLYWKEVLVGHQQKGKSKKRRKSWHRGRGEAARWRITSKAWPLVDETKRRGA